MWQDTSRHGGREDLGQRAGQVRGQPRDRGRPAAPHHSYERSVVPPYPTSLPSPHPPTLLPPHPSSWARSKARETGSRKRGGTEELVPTRFLIIAVIWGDSTARYQKGSEQGREWGSSPRARTLELFQHLLISLPDTPHLIQTLCFFHVSFLLLWLVF